MHADWIVEQMSDALIYVDRDGLILQWNRAACDLFGYAKDEALNQSLDIIIPEHLRKAHDKGFQAAIASGVTRLSGAPTVTRANHKDGHKLYVEMGFALVKDGSGQVVGSVATGRNVTERVERERAARAATPK